MWENGKWFPTVFTFNKHFPQSWHPFCMLLFRSCQVSPCRWALLAVWVVFEGERLSCQKAMIHCICLHPGSFIIHTFENTHSHKQNWAQSCCLVVSECHCICQLEMLCHISHSLECKWSANGKVEIPSPSFLSFSLSTCSVACRTAECAVLCGHSQRQ